MGLVNALSVLACLSTPAMNQRAWSLRSAYLFPAKSGRLSFQMEIFTCMPLPLSSAIGFGMKVADLPYASATL